MNNTNTTKTCKNESEHLSSHPVFSEFRVARFLVFCAMLRRSTFVLLSFFFWPLCFLFFDLHLLITPLVSSNSSFKNGVDVYYLYCFRVVSRTVKNIGVAILLIDNYYWDNVGKASWTTNAYLFSVQKLYECSFMESVIILCPCGIIRYAFCRSLYPDLR